MNYEQRYKEALEAVKELQEVNPSDEGIQNWVNEKFPELAESKAEKIRKTLIEFFGKGLEYNSSTNGIPDKDIVVWLEKQGKETGWKPSKEEMDVLYGLAYITNQYDERKEEVITRLYQDLKREFFKGSSYENMFPTSTSTEDDVRRRSTIQVLEYARSLNTYNQYGKADIDKNIAWLEKQGEQKHLELKAGHWYYCHSAYCCRADNLTVKEGERFQCEKDGVVKGFVIKDPEKYFKEISVPLHSEDIQTDEVRRRSTIQVLEYARSLDTYNQYGKADIDKNIAWLEKQGENKPIIGMKSPEESLGISSKEYNEVVNNCLYGESKPADKVEPKFKVGDWVVIKANGNENVRQIVRIEYFANGQPQYISSNGLWFGNGTEARLWTIQDAKDGDVLVASDNSVFIYAGSTDRYAQFYIALSKYGDFNTEGGNWEDKNCVKPATKEQRDTLMKAMADAGWKFDFEKNELKKICVIDEGKAEMDYCFTKMMNGEKVSSA